MQSIMGAEQIFDCLQLHALRKRVVGLAAGKNCGGMQAADARNG